MKQRNRVTFFNILSTCLLYGISIFTAPLFSRLLGTGGYGNLANYKVWSACWPLPPPCKPRAPW